jgi:hypothetical protein
MSLLMKAYAGKVRKLERCFSSLQLEHLPRGQDTNIKELSQIAAKGLQVPAGTFVEKLSKPSAVPEEEVAGAPPATSLGAPLAVKLREDTTDSASKQCSSPIPTGHSG